MNPFEELDLIGIITSELYSAHGYSYIIFDHEDTVSIDIEWGDWKHDHGFLQQFMEERGFEKLEEEVTESDSSDTYSATHVYKLKESEKINEDMEVIKSPNTHVYWIYDNKRDAYFDTDVHFRQMEEEDFIRKFNKVGFSLYSGEWIKELEFDL